MKLARLLEQVFVARGGLFIVETFFQKATIIIPIITIIDYESVSYFEADVVADSKGE